MLVCLSFIYLILFRDKCLFVLLFFNQKVYWAVRQRARCTQWSSSRSTRHDQSIHRNTSSTIRFSLCVYSWVVLNQSICLSFDSYSFDFAVANLVIAARLCGVGSAVGAVRRYWPTRHWPRINRSIPVCCIVCCDRIVLIILDRSIVSDMACRYLCHLHRLAAS